ncbi:uncharacterized protein LOC129592958 [Paramacrobiotus metropolitanus]|uniref:uncharacterized protein LOC129592958 n=1 Tax=Paramacrobiotus metropolitanus TaxID=2943436 RepID=UPI002445C835|nr:uncharacterized protein LOC129592958 [Paramacrobiotus metropolitanus]
MEALVDVRDLLPVVPAVVIDVEPKEGPEMVLEENIIPIDDCDSLSSPSKSGNEILSEVKKPSFTIEVDINQHLLSKLCTLYPDEVLLPLLAGTASADHRRGAFNHLMSALVDQEKYAASCKLQLTSPLLSPSSLTRDVIVDVLELVDRCCVDATLLAAEQFHLAVLNLIKEQYGNIAEQLKDFLTSQAASRQILVENVDSRHVGCKWHYEMLQSVEFCEEYTAYNVPGDGNCFFRAISLAKTGSDEHYLAMRLAAVFGMLHYGQAFEQLYENSHPKSKPRTFPELLKIACLSKEESSAASVNADRYGMERHGGGIALFIGQAIYSYDGYSPFIDPGSLPLDCPMKRKALLFPTKNGSVAFDFRPCFPNKDGVVDKSLPILRIMNVKIQRHFYAVIPKKTNCKEYRPGQFLQLF